MIDSARSQSYNMKTDKDIWKQTLKHDIEERFITKPGGKPLPKEIVETAKKRVEDTKNYNRIDILEDKIEMLEKKLDKLEKYVRIKSSIDHRNNKRAKYAQQNNNNESYETQSKQEITDK